ncbi:MAG: glutamyl-tRNA reductase [Verrucomicrobiota bacterium]
MSSRPASPGAPTLLVAGITHHTAPLEMRERLALPKDEAATVLTHLRETPSLREAAFLSTCNRMELYAVPDPAAEVQPNLPELLAGLLKAPPSMIAELGFVARDADAVQHLFEVASGLDSQMIGETEILGQVKDAYQRAREARVVGSLLNRVFQKSFQAAKWARSSTGIGQGQVSIGSVVVELASRIFGDLRASRVLIIGTGEVAERTLQALQSRGLHYLTVASRTLERAARLAEPLKGAALALDQVAEYLPRFDIIIACASAATRSSSSTLPCRATSTAPPPTSTRSFSTTSTTSPPL